MGNWCTKCCPPWTMATGRHGAIVVPLVMIGSSGAGKTYIANRMRNKWAQLGPTLGCHVHTIEETDKRIRVTEIGGTVDCVFLRNEFLQSCMGVIFVFNASLANNLSIQKAAIQSLLNHPYAIGKPTLMFATHQDRNELGEEEIVETLQLDFLSRIYQTPINLIACGEDDMVAYRQGFDWIVESIIKDFKRFTNRIQFDQGPKGPINKNASKKRHSENAVRPKTSHVMQKHLPAIIQVAERDDGANTMHLS